MGKKTRISAKILIKLTIRLVLQRPDIKHSQKRQTRIGISSKTNTINIHRGVFVKI